MLLMPAVPQVIQANAAEPESPTPQATDPQKDLGVTAGTLEPGAEPVTVRPAANPIDGQIIASAGNTPMLRQTAPPLTTTPFTTPPPDKSPLPTGTPAMPPTQSPVRTALSATLSVVSAQPSLPTHEQAFRRLASTTTPLTNVPIDKAHPGKASSLPVPVKVALETAPTETALTDPVPAPVEAQLPNVAVISSKAAATPDQDPAQPRLAATAVPDQEDAATPSPATRFTAPPSTLAQSQEVRSNRVPPVVTQKPELPAPSRATTTPTAQPVTTVVPAHPQKDFIASQAAPEAAVEPDPQTNSTTPEPTPAANSRPAALSGPSKPSRHAVAARVQSAPIAPVSSQETVTPPAQSNDAPAQSPALAGQPVATSGQKPADQAKQLRDVSSTRTNLIPLQSASAAVLAPDVPVPSATPAPGHNDTQKAGQSAPQLPAQAGNATLVGTTPAVPSAPRTENLAFTLQMTRTDALPARAPVLQPKPVAVEPAPARRTDSNVVPREPQSSTAPEAFPDNRASAYAEVLRKNSAPEAGLHWADATSMQHSDVRAASAPGESAEPSPAGPASPAADIQLPLEASHKTPVNQGILLQVGGNNQATASIRVADRAGTVNISVHATDPDLRNSLRSNLGDLSSQLNTQGWRTEVSRPVPAATHAENARDSRSEGERSSSQQQQTTGGGRQQSQQRRANSGRWQDEFEEVSSQPASTGGKT